MTIADSHQKQLEQAIIQGNKLQAYRLYRELYKCDTDTAKSAVKKLEIELRKSQPKRFTRSTGLHSGKNAIKIGKGAVIAFVLFDFVLFAAAIWWFFLSDNNSNPSTQSGITSLSTSIDKDTYTTTLESNETFQSLYEEKLDSWLYSLHKSGRNSHKIHDIDDEAKIKTARSHLAANRPAPVQSDIIDIAVNTSQQPTIDGRINDSEWSFATALNIGDNQQTTLYFTSDGEWLFIACNAKNDTTEKGFDQFRIYLHAGLIPEMKHERLHLGRGSYITSIRQTTYRWQGSPPDNDDERWKKYSINDKGIYQYAVGSTRVRNNRQYEMAIHMGEAGLHRGIPFTLHAVVETDPLRNKQGKFKGRQYLGYLGDNKNPKWFSIKL